jgi:L,D-transpeptidase YcbB
MIKPCLTLILFFCVEINFANEFIKNKLKDAKEKEHIKVESEYLYSSVLIPEFYKERDYKLAWFNEGKTENALKLINALVRLDLEGLNPNDYHLALIQKLSDELTPTNLNEKNEKLAHLDILLSDAFILAASHLYLGKVNPENIKAEWNIRRNRSDIDFKEQLSIALETGKITTILGSLSPNNLSYQLLKKELKNKRESLLRSDWDNIKFTKSIHPCDESVIIPEIIKRIQILEDTIFSYDTSDFVYENWLVNLIGKIQKKHGLNPDGVIGKNTIDALNISPNDRIKIAIVNLERLRWLPRNIENEHIWVNIADFSLKYINNNDTLANLKVVVGKNFRKTPVFRAEMDHLVFSPTWTVPPTIFKNDVLPELKKNPNYLTSKNMKIVDINGKTINPNSIDWANTNSQNFKYKVRQNSGEQNALGGIKFMFPNPYFVYIHDTPTKNLFDKDIRNFSSGCIRVEKPDVLATIILNNKEKWSIEKVREAMYNGKERRLNLENKIPVYITYFTAWADLNGINFRQDIYSNDQSIANALSEKPKFN